MKFRKLRRTVPNRVTETFLSELHQFHITYSHNNLYKKHYSRCDNNRIVVFKCCIIFLIIIILICYICIILNIQNIYAISILLIPPLILLVLALSARFHFFFIYMCNRNIYNKLYKDILNGLKYEQTNHIELRKAMFHKLCNKYQIDTHKVNIKTMIDIIKSYNQRNNYDYSSTTLNTLFIGIALVIITLGLNIYIYYTHETEIIIRFIFAIIYIIVTYFAIRYSKIIESFNELLNSKHHVTLEMLESILINDTAAQQENDIK